MNMEPMVFKFSDPGCTAHYMDTLLDIVKGYRDNQKDDFLAISVIQTCIDVVPDFYHLPKTRNSIVHAKSNYEPNGLKCPPDSLEEVNQMMSSIGRALIQWNENQADYIRV